MGVSVGTGVSLDNVVTYSIDPITQKVTIVAGTSNVVTAAASPYYYFHGFAGTQLLGDPKFYDIAAGNSGSFGANLSNANAWANAGYVSTVDPVGGTADSVIRIPSINFDYSGGEKLIVWWLGAITPEGADVAMMGDGTATTTGFHGIRVRAKTTGKFDIAMYGATSTFSGASDGVVFDGTLHSFAFCFDGANKTHGLWSDEVYQAAFGSAYGLFSGGTDFDTKTSNTFNIGAASGAPGTTDGIAVKTRALVIMKLPASMIIPNVATMTNIFKQLRANPSKLISSSAI